MVIQTEHMKENGWRLAGSDLDWQLQKIRKDKKSPEGWKYEGFLFYATFESALKAAYEKTLRESKKEASSIKDVLEECRKVKGELIEAVKEAV
jgi:hypothetical protein